jgi:hypothetical protein
MSGGPNAPLPPSARKPGRRPRPPLPGTAPVPQAGRLYAAWMPGALATRIIVFGRGLVAEGTGLRLTCQSSERVEAPVACVRQNAAAFAVRRGRIVFSGGWTGAAEGFGRPPRQYREGSLMLAQAMAADIGSTSLAGYADVCAEIEPTARWRTCSGLKRTVTSTARPLPRAIRSASWRTRSTCHGSVTWSAMPSASPRTR